jgi:hypothetical protein
MILGRRKQKEDTRWMKAAVGPPWCHAFLHGTWRYTGHMELHLSMILWLTPSGWRQPSDHRGATHSYMAHGVIQGTWSYIFQWYYDWHQVDEGSRRTTVVPRIHSYRAHGVTFRVILSEQHGGAAHSRWHMELIIWIFSRSPQGGYGNSQTTVVPRIPTRHM